MEYGQAPSISGRLRASNNSSPNKSIGSSSSPKGDVDNKNTVKSQTAENIGGETEERKIEEIINKQYSDSNKKENESKYNEYSPINLNKYR